MLTKMDRCDRCVAEARVLIEISGGKLMFCQHHYNKHEKALKEQGAMMIFSYNETKESVTV